MVADSDKLIVGREKLTSIFGYWPSFHDAEVIDVQLWRGQVNADANADIFPVLTVKIHVWELTREVDSRGHLVRRHHTLTTLRFHDVIEFRMDGFDQQNAIFGLSIELNASATRVRRHLSCDVRAGFWHVGVVRVLSR